jgi:hypothetical protein
MAVYSDHPEPGEIARRSPSSKGLKEQGKNGVQAAYGVADHMAVPIMRAAKQLGIPVGGPDGLVISGSQPPERQEGRADRDRQSLPDHERRRRKVRRPVQRVLTVPTKTQAPLAGTRGSATGSGRHPLSRDTCCDRRKTA